MLDKGRRVSRSDIEYIVKNVAVEGDSHQAKEMESGNEDAVGTEGLNGRVIAEPCNECCVTPTGVE